MRIIDKNTDYYDYLQYINPDDTFTFDRSDSYELTKDIVCGYLWLHRRGWIDKRYKNNSNAYKFMLMQIGSTFWLFLLKISNVSRYGQAEDYEIELLKSWKNYSKDRQLIKISIIEFGFEITYTLRKSGEYGVYFDDFNKDIIYSRLDTLIKAIDTNDYDTFRTIDNHTVYVGSQSVCKHIPILKSCGISMCVPPEDIYNAFDEYFSLEKTASESTVAEGTTNNDKIINHGFDTKTSFRGK